MCKESAVHLPHSLELEKSVADLWWSIDPDEREIVFELHIRTTDWIALGINPCLFLFLFSLL